MHACVCCAWQFKLSSFDSCLAHSFRFNFSRFCRASSPRFSLQMQRCICQAHDWQPQIKTKHGRLDTNAGQRKCSADKTTMMASHCGDKIISFRWWYYFCFGKESMSSSARAANHNTILRHFNSVRTLKTTAALQSSVRVSTQTRKWQSKLFFVSLYVKRCWKRSEIIS